MSDIFSTSTGEVNSVTVDKLLYGNESIGYAIRPELVSRTSLHPTIVDGKLEKRVYYSLHNDAGDCVYVSPFIATNGPNGTNYPTLIPGNPSNDLSTSPDFSNPPVPPSIDNSVNNGEGDEGGDDFVTDVPPPPTGNIIWPPVVTGDEREDSGDDEWWIIDIGDGGGGNTDGNPQAISYETNFDDYAEKLAKKTWDGHYPSYPINGKTSNVYKFFETTQAAVTMNRAMAYTMDEYKGFGLKTIGIMPKVVSAEEMYRGSVIHEHTGSFPKLVNAKGMFRDCPSLTRVYVTNSKGAANIEDASYMFDSDDSLESVTLNAMTRVSNVDYMFYGCSSLKTVNMTVGNHLESGFCMFAKCTNLRNRISIPSSVTNGAFMFDGCEHIQRDYSSLVNIVDGRAMFRNNLNITYVDLNLPSLVDGSHMYSGCEATNIAGTIDLRSLKYGNCMLKDTRLSPSDVDRIMTHLDKDCGGMPTLNPSGNIPNGIQIGVLTSITSPMKMEDLEEKWKDKYNAEEAFYELESGWIVTLNKFSTI